MTDIIYDGFINNKYLNAYKSMVSDKQGRQKGDVYYEKHHIIPRSMGGGVGDNLVLLTAKEHFIAHHLLTKCTTGDAQVSMHRAFWLMSNKMTSPANKGKRDTYRVTSRVYESARSEYIRLLNEDPVMSQRIRTIGKNKSEETCKRLSVSNLLAADYGREHRDADKTIYRFYNVKTDELIVGLVYDLADHLGISHHRLSDMKTGNNISYKREWMLWHKGQPKPEWKTSQRDRKVYLFHNPKTSEDYSGMVEDFCKYTGAGRGDVLAHINTPATNKSVRGFVIWDGIDRPTWVKGRGTSNGNFRHGKYVQKV